MHFLLLSDMKGHVHELLQDSHMFSDLTVYRGENMLSHSSICLSDSNVKKNLKIFLKIFQPHAKKKKIEASDNYFLHCELLYFYSFLLLSMT